MLTARNPALRSAAFPRSRKLLLKSITQHPRLPPNHPLQIQHCPPRKEMFQRCPPPTMFFISDSREHARRAGDGVELGVFVIGVAYDVNDVVVFRIGEVDL